MPLLRQTVRDHRNRPVEVDCLGAAAAAYPIALVVMLACGCAVSAALPNAATVGFTLLTFVLLFTSPLMLVRWQAAFAPRHMSERLLGLECPVCRYGLTGVRPAEDGCTQCPECGAAWRLESGTDVPARRIGAHR